MWRRLRRRRRGVIARALHATRVSNRVNMYRTKGEEEDDSRSECGFIHLLLASFPFRPKEEEEKVKWLDYCSMHFFFLSFNFEQLPRFDYLIGKSTINRLSKEPQLKMKTNQSLVFCFQLKKQCFLLRWEALRCFSFEARIAIWCCPARCNRIPKVRDWGEGGFVWHVALNDQWFFFRQTTKGKERKKEVTCYLYSFLLPLWYQLEKSTTRRKFG